MTKAKGITLFEPPRQLDSRGLATDLAFQDAFHKALCVPRSSQSGNCRKAAREFASYMLALAQDAPPMLRRLLVSVQVHGATWRHIKAASQLCHEKKGNVTYACMYHCLAALSPECYEILTQLAAHWPSLGLDWDDTDNSIGSKSGILEILQNVWWSEIAHQPGEEETLTTLGRVGLIGVNPDAAERVRRNIKNAGDVYGNWRRNIENPVRFQEDIGCALRSMDWHHPAVLARCFLSYCQGPALNWPVMGAQCHGAQPPAPQKLPQAPPPPPPSVPSLAPPEDTVPHPRFVRALGAQLRSTVL